jgi:hypothetical protein
LLDADADRADLELWLIKLLLKDRARAGNDGSWRKADEAASFQSGSPAGAKVRTTS